MMKGRKDNEESEEQTLAEVITVQFSDAGCHTIFPTVRKRNTGFNIYGNWALV